MRYLTFALAFASLILSACAGERTPTTINDVTIHSIRIDSTNVGIVEGPDRTILIDVGLEGAFAQLKTAMQEQSIDASAISDLVLTHGHGDHGGDANAVQAEGIAVWAHADELPTLQNEAGALEDGEIIGAEAHLVAALISHEWESVTPDHVFDTPITFADVGVRVIPVGGHTPGSVMMVVQDEIAFVGDLIRGGSLGGAIAGDQPNVHYFHVDKNGAHRSLRGLLEGFPNVHTIWPSHGDAFTREKLQEFVDAQPNL